MANKKENKIPVIEQKWFKLPKIDPATLRPIHFSWQLVSGKKTVAVYNKNVENSDIINANVRNYITSHYYVLDKKNKRIFAYPVYLSGNDTRKGCETAHWEEITYYWDRFYMIDENKQIWEIPKSATRRVSSWDATERRYVYEAVPTQPTKKARYSTMHYKTSCQLASHIREMFSYLFGDEFIWQSHLVTDQQINAVHYYWTQWLSTKGRKLSEKTMNKTRSLMDQLGPRGQNKQYVNNDNRPYYHKGLFIELKSVNGTVFFSYYDEGVECARRVFNKKTGKLENYIWKVNEWYRQSNMSSYVSVDKFIVDESYQKEFDYDFKLLLDAYDYYERTLKSYTSPNNAMYNFTENYVKLSALGQILQIQDKQAREELYKKRGDIEIVYGKMPNTGKTLYRKLGVNKHQMQSPRLIAHIKDILGVKDIAFIDNKTWDTCLASITPDDTHSYGNRNIISFLKSVGKFSLLTWAKINELNRDHNAEVRGLNTGWYSGRDEIKSLYSDYYRSLEAMNEFGMDISNYPLVFNDHNQLRRFHDQAAMAVSNVKNRAADEKFAMLYEKRTKMLEDDGEYIIDMPKCSADLTNEGSCLHHCVGGYVRTVADGGTAIYFLRKKSEPHTPWLTVEVSSKICRQIHGSCNAWMGSRDEYFAAVPFLVYWFNKHDIEFQENLLTNMATGYSSISSRRDMPHDKIKAYAEKRKQASKSKAS